MEQHASPDGKLEVDASKEPFNMWRLCRISERQDCTPEGFRWLSLHRLKYTDHHGRAFGWEAVERSSRPPGTDCDGVAVFAKVVSRRRPMVVPVVVQYRPALGCLSVELPAGLVEEGQGVEETALRELVEEAGYTGRVVGVSPLLVESPGMTSSSCKLAVVEVDGDDPANTHPEACPEAGEVLRCEILPYDDLLPALVRLCERYGSAEYGTGGSEDGSSVEGAQELGQGHTCGGGMDAGAAGNGARMAGSEMRCVLDARLYALALGLELGRAAGVQDRDREGRGEAGGLAGRQQQQQEQQPQGVLEPGEQLVQVQGGVGNVCSTACVPGPGVAEAGTDTAAVPQSAAGTQGARAAGQAEGEGVVAIAAGPGGGGWRLNDDDVPSAAGWRAAFVAQLEGLDEHEIREIMGEDEQGHAAAANGHVCGGRGGGDVEGGQGDGQGSGGSKGGLGAGRGGVQQVGSGVARVGSGDVGGGSGASGSAVAVASGAGSMGAGEGEAAQGAFPGAAALPNVVRWAALRAMGRDSAAAAPAAAAAGGGGAKDTVPGTRTSHTGGSGHRNGHWRGYGQGGGGGGRERVRARWMEGAGEAAAEGGAGGDDGGGERHGGRRGRRHYRGRQHGGGGGGGPMKPKPRGPPTVGGGGSKRGFAGGNVGPLSKLRGGTAGGGGSSSSWRAMQAASRSLCDVAAWRAWAAADPVASGCGVALAACAVAAGVLAARAAVAGARG